MSKICGIYRIINTYDNKIYIGQSIDCIKRLNMHKSRLNCNKYDKCSPYLQSAYNKYGKDVFKFEIFFLCNQQDLDGHEIFFINFFKTFGENGYNLTAGGESHLGTTQTPERILKTIISNKTRKLSEESIKRASEAQLGKKASLETRLKMSLAHKGNKSMTGKKHTPETIQKMINSRKGKKRGKYNL